MKLIDSGDQEGWRMFVSRFQRRLMAFACKRVQPTASAEDLVQETFVAFLSSRKNYRGEGELESYLFRILRRRIVDHYRREGVVREIPVCDFAGSDAVGPIDTVPAPQPTASWYVRRSEQNEQDFLSLAAAVQRLALHLQAGARLIDLEIAEGLFFARRRNQELAAALGVSENIVAVTKRRLIERLRSDLQSSMKPQTRFVGDDAETTDLLSRVWESERPSCPKRTTLGKFTLGILPDHWDQYVRFHVETLGCSFCNANLDELRSTTASSHGDDTANDRLFQSTIGFFGAKNQ
ncbi:MAG: sigma-70 family RNA polymerase sigma factor [Planctomycetales bacterium]|nr:sigma-70 family RNA polymerase sigma factor [Planctomycetales bacterium]